MERLRERVESRVGADGTVHDPCRSRVLESALALRLMERAGSCPTARDRVAAYLWRQYRSARGLDRVLAGLVLGHGEAMGPRVLEELLGGVPGFVAPRRRAMLDCVLVLLGGCPAADGPPERDGTAPQGGLHPWAQVQSTAARVVLQAADGRGGEISREDERVLMGTQRPGLVWEQYTLCHLLALHALCAVGGHERTVQAGLEAVLAHQREDGGFPFIADVDTWNTSTAGVALMVAGASRPVLERIASCLLERQRPSGAWATAEGTTVTDVDDTSLAVEFLHNLDPRRYGEAADRGLKALLAVRGADGGFPTYVAGAPSEPCMTAAAINAFSLQGSSYAPLLRDARASLAASQYPDGGFAPGWSNSRLHALFRARQAAGLRTAPTARMRAMAERIEHTVLKTQNDDGGWGAQPGTPSDPISTGYALAALCCGTMAEPAVRAAAWLLSVQRADGGFDGPPDMVGPRPFPFHIPVLTDIWVLLGLGHLCSRLASPRRRPANRAP